MGLGPSSTPRRAAIDVQCIGSGRGAGREIGAEAGRGEFPRGAQCAAAPPVFGHTRDDRAPALELALGGGEDYELLAPVPHAAVTPAGRPGAEAGIGLYEIGEAAGDLPPDTLVGLEADGSERPLEWHGFRHSDGRGR